MSEKEVTLRVQNSSTFIDGSLRAPVYKELKKALGYKDQNAIWRSTAHKWDGWITTVCYSKFHCKCPVPKEGTHFPTGLLSKAIEFFKINNVPVKLIDERSEVIRDRNYTMSESFEPRDYQSMVIDNALPLNSNKGGRGIVKCCTGSGKTAIASSLVARAGVIPAVFYVTSIDLLKQAKDELERFIRLDGKSLNIGAVGGGFFDIQDITVMTVQTAVRSLGGKFQKIDDESDDDNTKITDTNKINAIKNLVKSAKLIICDECQHWAASTCQIISDHSVNARYKWGFSATPSRDQGDDLLIDACFGKTVADINASMLIQKNVLVKPTIYFIPVYAKIDGSFAQIYKDGIVNNLERNNIIANLANKMVAKGRQILILVKHIEHGNILEDMIENSFFVHGSHTAKLREEWLAKMKKKEAPVTVASVIYDEGVNVPSLDGLILAGGGKSPVRALQRIGRVIRPYSDPSTGFVKKDALVVDFMDYMPYMKEHSMKRKKMYMTEPEFVIKMLENPYNKTSSQ